MFWNLLPAPVIGGQEYRSPHFSIDERLDTKFFFYEKSVNRMAAEVILSVGAEFLTKVWMSYIKDAFDLNIVIQAKAKTISFAMTVMDKWRLD